MAQEQNPGMFGTVLSYVPGFGGGSVEDHKKTSEQTHEESHKKQTNDGTSGVNAGSAGSTGANNSGTFTSGSNVGAGSKGTETGGGYGSAGSKGTETGTGYGSGNQGSYTNTGSGQGTGNYGSTGPSSGQQGQYTSQAGGNNYGSDTGNQKPNVDYEDDTVGAGNTSQLGGSSTGTFQSGYNPQGGSSTGTHHSGYQPQGGSSQGTGEAQADNGVRGAPIEGDGVKGYAIGAPVGSGDTEKPNKPGDPSGQVSGAHLEYGPEETDTRDSRGRGTVGKSAGTGDSSFANVKTSDGQGNSTHVMTRTNESHMHSSSTTQL